MEEGQKLSQLDLEVHSNCSNAFTRRKPYLNLTYPNALQMVIVTIVVIANHPVNEVKCKKH